MEESASAPAPARPFPAGDPPAPSGSLDIPANSLVLLIGASASGKSSWAHRWFATTQIVSSDRCRALVCDDEADQTVNPQAFAVFYEIIQRRLQLGRLTVADSTALTTYPRARLREIADAWGAPTVAVVVCTPLPALLRNNVLRGRHVPEHVLERHARQIRDLVLSRTLEGEGYQAVHYLRFPSLPAPRIVAPLEAAPTGAGANPPS